MLGSAALLGLVACGERPSSAQQPTTATDGRAGGLPGATAADDQPRTLRIVSLVPSLTETLVALGAADALVGIGRFDPGVPGRPGLPRLGDTMSVSVEAVTATAPDVVLVNGAGLRDRLAGLPHGIELRTVPTDRLSDALTSIRALGELTGREGAAAELVQRLETAVAAARARTRERAGPPPRVLFVVQTSPVYTTGRGSYLHELLEIVGADNVAGDIDSAWPTLSMEGVLARAPDVVLDASAGVDASPDARRAAADLWKRYPTLPAVAAGRVHALGAESEALFRSGPRLLQAIALLERLVHGERRPR